MNQATARSIRFEKGLLGALFCFWADDDLRVAKPRVLWIKRSFISRRGRVKTTKTLCSNDHFYSSSPAKIVCVSYTPSPNPMKKIKEEYLKHKNTKTSPTSHCSRV